MLVCVLASQAPSLSYPLMLMSNIRFFFPASSGGVSGVFFIHFSSHRKKYMQSCGILQSFDGSNFVHDDDDCVVPTLMIIFYSKTVFFFLSMMVVVLVYQVGWCCSGFLLCGGCLWSCTTLVGNTKFTYVSITIFILYKTFFIWTFFIKINYTFFFLLYVDITLLG